MRKGERAFDVALFHRIVRQICGGPQCVGFGIAVDAELYIAVSYAEEADPIVKAGLDQVEQMVHADGRPVAMNFDYHLALRGIEDRVEDVRRFLDLRRGLRYFNLLGNRISAVKIRSTLIAVVETTFTRKSRKLPTSSHSSNSR